MGYMEAFIYSHFTVLLKSWTNFLLQKKEVFIYDTKVQPTIVWSLLSFFSRRHKKTLVSKQHYMDKNNRETFYIILCSTKKEKSKKKSCTGLKWPRPSKWWLNLKKFWWVWVWILKKEGEKDTASKKKEIIFPLDIIFNSSLPVQNFSLWLLSHLKSVCLSPQWPINNLNHSTCPLWFY